jgi:membrane glycosyltransferase
LSKKKPASAKTAAKRALLHRKAISEGPDSLSAAEKHELLRDPVSLAAMHRAVWELADPQSARLWGLK